jgi:predicted short-subunit dehydrogenase-like oxidoreductase (DUF2520 family)
MMQFQETMSVSVIGTGNLAWHLIRMFTISGISVSEVIGRNKERLHEMANEFHIRGKELEPDCVPLGNIVFIAVSDTAIGKVIQKITPGNYIPVHCSACTSIEIFQDKFEHYGVFSLFPTFTKGSMLDYTKIPVFLEGNNSGSLEVLKNIAEKVTSAIYEIDSQKRMVFHLAGVMVSNFSNHLYTLAWKIMEDNHLNTSLLLPLISSTADKVKHIQPVKAQTGPAARGDNEIMMKHIQLLGNYPDIKDIYLQISRSIAEYSGKKMDA